MKRFALIPILILTAIGAAGCATGERHAARLAALDGADKETVKSVLGEPTRTDTASDGRMLWSYYQSASRPLPRDYGTPGFTAASSSAGAGGKSAVFICVTTVRFNAQGHVEATDFEGDHCL